MNYVPPPKQISFYPSDHVTLKARTAEDVTHGVGESWLADPKATLMKKGVNPTRSMPQKEKGSEMGEDKHRHMDWLGKTKQRVVG